MAMLAGWQRMGSGGRRLSRCAPDAIAARVLRACPASPTKSGPPRPIADRAALTPARACPTHPRPTRFRPRVPLPAEARLVRRDPTVLNPMEVQS